MILADRAENGAVALVARVNDATQIVVVRREGVGLIQQHRRPRDLDGAEQRRRRDVRHLERARHEARQHQEHRRLAWQD